MTAKIVAGSRGCRFRIFLSAASSLPICTDMWIVSSLTGSEICFLSSDKPDCLFDQGARLSNIEYRTDQYCSSQLMRRELQERQGLACKPEAPVELFRRDEAVDTRSGVYSRWRNPSVVLFVKPARHEFRAVPSRQLGGLAFRFLVLGLARLAKLFDLPFRFGLSDTVSLLYLSYELVALACEDIQFVIGKLSPLLLHLPFDLLPITFDLVPVHDSFSFSLILFL
jgi:hypothetical protein